MEEEKKQDEQMNVEGAQPVEGAPSAESTEQVPTGRAAQRKRMAEKYPDENWEEMDDDTLADRSMKDYDELKGKMDEREANDKKLSDLFEKNPQSASFLMGMARGEDFLVNLQKNFGEDIVEAMQNPDKLEELAKANKEYQDKVSKNKQLQSEWETNMAESLNTLAEQQESLGLSDDEVQQGMDELARIVNEYNNGKLSAETIQLFLKAANYDTDVEEAGRQGEVAGRNANIKETLKKSQKETDGLANLGGQSNNFNTGEKMPQKARSIFDVASGAK